MPVGFRMERLYFSYFHNYILQLLISFLIYYLIF
jgi:hypothetical protein